MFIKLIMTTVCFAAAAHASLAGVMHFHDPVTGDWDVTLRVVAAEVTGTMKLRLEGKNVTGTIETAHTGAGTVTKGKWEGGKLSFTAEFAKHESIVVTGTAKGDALEGEFLSEGNIGKWTAAKHPAAASTQGTTVPGESAHLNNSMSGDWNATLSGNGTTAPLLLKLTIVGEKVSGTFVSDHMGSGTIEDGWLKDGKIGFSLKLAKTSVQMNGTLAKAQFSGDFGSGPRKGTWIASKK